jgi:hypothetical protein
MTIDELDRLVIEADPTLDVAIPSGTSAEARWQYVQLTSGRPAPARHRGRMLRNAGFIAAALSALVLLLINVIPGSSRPRSAAAAVFEQAAAVAGQQKLQLMPDQYLYTETQSRYQVTLYSAGASSQTRAVTAQFDETDQAWTDASGSSSVLQTDSTVHFPSAADEAAWNESPNGASMLQQIARFAETGGQAHSQRPSLDVSDLPTDPSTLATVIADGELHTNVNLIPAGPNATFDRTATLLVGPTTGMTPALASALFQVLANQPGVQLLGTVTDHEGQRGQAITLRTAHGLTVSTVIVDPSTGTLLEAQFAPPGSTVPTPNAEMCTGPTANASVPRSCHPAVGGQSILAPLWTDVVSSGTVDSNTATLPPLGNGHITAALVPGPPIGLRVTLDPALPGQALLSWSAPVNTGGSPITDYVVYEYVNGITTPDTGPTGISDTHSTATNYSLLLVGQVTTVTVQAVNADGYGAASNPESVSP